MELAGEKKILNRISNGEEFVAIHKGKILGAITVSNKNLAYIGAE